MEINNGKEILCGAKWIWPVNNFFDLVNTYAHFRKDFIIEKLPERALFYITADQCYRLWINGKYVTRGPARGYQAHWPYDGVDIAAFLQKGNNYICVEAYNAGISTFGYLTQTRAGMLCGGDFGDISIRSDSSWISRMDTAHKRDTQRYSLQLNFQEHVDTRKDDRLWITSPAAPKGWIKPEELQFGSMPWFDIEERGIPLLHETLRSPLKVVATADGMVRPGYRNVRNNVYVLYREFKKLIWKTHKEMPAKEGNIIIPASTKGKFKAFVLDMGELVVGPSKIYLEGGKRGQVVDLFFHERIASDSSPVVTDPDVAGCRMAMGNRLVLSGDKVAYDFFQILGFRYITLVVRENLQPVSVSIEVSDTAYPYEMQGSFECSDEAVNKIWDICRRTEQVCSLDSYVDTPWREQAQWWGDARIQFWNTMAMDGDTRLFKRGIRSIAGQSVPNGLTYGHAPTMAHNCILPDFSLVWIMTIYDYYRQTGDLSLFLEQQSRVQSVIGYFRKEAPVYKGLLAYDKRYWLFLDWSNLEKEGVPTLLNMWYLLTLRTLSVLYKLTDMEDLSAQIEKESNELEKSIIDILFDAETGLFFDGLDTNGEPYSIHSVHSQTMAVILGLKSDFHGIMFEKRILPFLRGSKLDVPVPSTYWTSYVLTVARKMGYSREAIEYMKRMWTPMIPLGTCLEVFDDQPGEFSASHAWSAHPLFHLMNILGGVVQGATGWNTITYEPYFDRTMEFVKIKHPSPHGLIESSWVREKAGISVKLSLPEAITAKIKLPGYEGEVRGKFEYMIKE